MGDERCDDMSNLLKTDEIDTKVKMNLDFIQDLFEMQDVQKWLKLNSTDEKQIKHYEKAESIMQRLLEKLYVPNLAIENA